MASTSTKVGHSLAKVLGIDLHYRHETGSERITRGESVFSVNSADNYVEQEPTAIDWLHEVIPTGQDVAHYFIHLFPFLHWITRYNVQWLIGDLVAGMSSLDTSYDTANRPRYHRRSCRRSTEYGLRETRPASSRVWAIFVFHGCPHLLVLRHIQGHHDRTCRCPLHRNRECSNQHRRKVARRAKRYHRIILGHRCWFDRPLSRSCSTGLDRRIHYFGSYFSLHDRFSPQHCCGSGARYDGTYQLFYQGSDV